MKYTLLPASSEARVALAPLGLAPMRCLCPAASIPHYTAGLTTTSLWEMVATIYMGVTRVLSKSGAVKEPSINPSLRLVPQFCDCLHMSTVLISPSPPL
jgi:hypothetical protein